MFSWKTFDFDDLAMLSFDFGPSQTINTLVRFGTSRIIDKGIEVGKSEALPTLLDCAP
jgi:hypothetical protein